MHFEACLLMDNLTMNDIFCTLMYRGILDSTPETVVPLSRNRT